MLRNKTYIAIALTFSLGWGGGTRADDDAALVECITPFYVATLMAIMCDYDEVEQPVCVSDAMQLQENDADAALALFEKMDVAANSYADARGFTIGDADDVCPAALAEIADGTEIGQSLREKP